MRVLYLAGGDISTVEAPSYQSMKMGEALGKKFADFIFISRVKEQANESTKEALWETYGIHSPFSLRLIHHSRSYFRRLFRLKSNDQQVIDYSSKLKPDLIITRSMSLSHLCLKRNWPVICESHIVPGHHRIPELCSMTQDKNLLGLLTLTDTLRDSYIQEGALAQKILPLYSGLDFNDYPHDTDRYLLRKKLSLPCDKRIAIFTGSLEYRKAVDQIIETAAYLPEVLFLIVGGEEALCKAWKTVARTVNIHNILFKGQVPRRHIPKYIQAADICLMTNKVDCAESTFSFPLKLMEYLASYRPVVANRTHCLQRTILKDGVNSVLVNANARDFAMAIKNLLQYPSYAFKLSSQARLDVIGYSWDDRVNKICQHFIS